MTEETHNKLYTANILYLSADAASNAIGPFSSWLLAGFGGSLAFILGNISTIGKYLSISSLRCSITIYIVALCFGLVEKFVGAIIRAGVSSYDAGTNIIKDHPDIGPDSASMVFTEVKKALIFPMSLLLSRAIDKAKSGEDILVMARLYSVMWQIQFIAVLIEFILCIVAIFIIARGLSS